MSVLRLGGPAMVNVKHHQDKHQNGTDPYKGFNHLIV
jgi:hypothetical protein